MHLRWTMFGMLASLVMIVSGCGSGSSSTIVSNPNATPVISALAPDSIPAGSQTFTLFISGTGFIAGSTGTTTAFWNGSPRTAVVNNDTNQIALSILASDVATPGVAQITASNPGPGGGLSQTAASFLITPLSPAGPIISSVTPASASPTQAAFTLTVTGSNFVASSNPPDQPCMLSAPACAQLAGSVVQFNSSPQTTAFVSANQLTATIASSTISTAGCNTVTVFTPDGVGGFVFSTSLGFALSKPGVPLICALSPASAGEN